MRHPSAVRTILSWYSPPTKNMSPFPCTIGLKNFEIEVAVADDVLVLGEVGQDLGQPALHGGEVAGDAARARVVDVRVGREDVVEEIERLRVDRRRVAREELVDLEPVEQRFERPWGHGAFSFHGGASWERASGAWV